MSIHIKPENKGKFNATKKRTGKTTEELTHSKNPLTRKRAIFALNAKKWHHALGGNLFPDGGNLLTNNYIDMNRFDKGGTKEPQYDKEAWHDYFNTQPTDPPYADDDHLFIENLYLQPQNVHYGNVSRYDYFLPNKNFVPDYVPNPNESKLFDATDQESPGDYYGFIPEVEIRAPYNDRVDRYCGDVANQLAQQEGVGDNNNFERLLYIVKDAYSNPDNLDQYGGFNLRGWALIAQNQMFGAGSHWNKEMSNTGKTFAKAASYLAPLGAALKSGELVPATFSAMSAFADLGFADIDKKAKEDKKRRYEKRLLNMDDDFIPGILNTAGSALGFALKNGGVLNNGMNRSYFDYGDNIYAPGGEMQMSPEEAAMMQQQGVEGMPPEMAGGMPAGAEQGMPVPLEGGMPPEMMGGQEQMSLEEMEEQQYEEERRQAFEEAREEAREEGKKTFEFEGRIYVTETGQLVNNEKACGGRLHGYGGNMFAYGGLEDYIDYDLGPGDPPTKKSSLNNVKVDNTIKGSLEKQAELIALLAGLKAYFLGKAREAVVNKIINAYNSTFKAPANLPNYDLHMGEEYVVSRDKYMKGDDTNYLREPLYDPAGLNNGTFMGGGAGGRIPWKDSPYYNDEWKILPLEEQRKRTFNEAYRDARNRGLKTFEFDGGLYTTDYNPNLENWKLLGDSRVETLNNGVYNIYNPIGVVPVKRNEGTHKAGVRHYRAEGGPLNYDIEEPYPYDEGYTPERAYQQLLFNDLEALRREAYNLLIKNRIKERLLREYGITEDELNASRRREARKKKKSKK